MNTATKMTILFLISLLVTACGTEDPKPLDETVETWVLKDEGQKENTTSVPQKIEGVCPSKIKFSIHEEAILEEPNGSVQNLAWTLYSPPPHSTTNIYIYKGNFTYGEDSDKENYIAVEHIAMLDYSEWSKENYLEFYFKDRNAQCAYKQIGKDNAQLF